MIPTRTWLGGRGLSMARIRGTIVRWRRSTICGSTGLPLGSRPAPCGWRCGGEVGAAHAANIPMRPKTTAILGTRTDSSVALTAREVPGQIRSGGRSDGGRGAPPDQLADQADDPDQEEDPGDLWR